MESKEKNWFARHKVLTVVGGLFLLFTIIGAAGGGDSQTKSSNGVSGKKAAEHVYRFSDRADKQTSDVEAAVGETATLDGVKMTVSNVSYQADLGAYQKAEAGKTFAVVTLQLENGTEKTQAYNSFNFRVQTAGGQVLDTSFASIDGQLSYGDLVAGGKASGKVVFQVPQEQGAQYLIWKPNQFQSDRAIIQLKQ
jgi:hypothetical protein